MSTVKSQMSNLVTEPHTNAVHDDIQEEEKEEEGVVQTHISLLSCQSARDWPTMRASTPRAAKALGVATILMASAKADWISCRLHKDLPLLAHCSALGAKNSLQFKLSRSQLDRSVCKARHQTPDDQGLDNTHQLLTSAHLGVYSAYIWLQMKCKGTSGRRLV